MKEIWGFLKFLSGLYLIYLAFYFLYWYIKMHFHPKWFWVFWIWTFLAIYLNYDHRRKSKAERDPRSGYEIWQENMKNYDAVRGY